MPDNRRHRGPHPQDRELFNASHLPLLHEANSDYCWLLSRGYASRAALALVGDKYQLHERQRRALMRVAATEACLTTRRAAQVPASVLGGTSVWIDTYNVLTTVEAALAGGVLLVARDGCLRDIAAMHGTFRTVEETVPSLELCGAWLEAAGVASARWLLDAPVSNSGRLATLIREIGAGRQWAWQAEVLMSPDRELKSSTEIIITADGVILDSGKPWFNLAREVVESFIPTAWIVSFAA